jgi:hypothetical protein
MSKLSKTVMVLVLVLTLGLHWTILQSVAWLSMIVRYSQHYPLRRAITMTFDGQHPCSICVFVSQGRHQEQQQDKQQITIQKLESVAFEPLAFTFQTAAPPLTASPDYVLAGRSEAPPSPPPRCA